MNKALSLLCLLALCLGIVLWVASSTGTRSSLADGPADVGDRRETGVGPREQPLQEPSPGRKAAPGADGDLAGAGPEAPDLGTEAPLTVAELEALQTEVPFGTLEVLVLRGRAPQPGAAVTVHGRFAGETPEEFDALGEAGRSGATDADGLVRFTGLGPDSYTVRAALPDGARLETAVLHSTNRHLRAVVVFGERRLVGDVYDAEGRPVGGCPILLHLQLEGLAFQSTRIRTLTDAAGRYELVGLPSVDRAFVECECLPAGAERRRATSLDVPERRVDFGARGGSPRWRGQLLDARGQPIRAGCKLALRRLADDLLEQVAVDAEGGIDAALVPGTYAVQLAGIGSPLDLGRIDVGWGGLDQDLVVPGTRVEVALDYAGNARSAADVLARQVVTLSATPELGGSPPGGSSPAGRIYFGVAPGTYWLQTRPHPPLGGAPLEIEVRAGQTVERVSVTLVDP